MYFYDEEFYGLLNSKKHLIPFKNGVFDLVKKEFRKTERDDYINLTVKYYDPTIKNPEVVSFIEHILPQEDVR
jgi:phage/plasmid-associated DNA primase